MAIPIVNEVTGLMTSISSAPMASITIKLQHDDLLTCALATNGFQYALESAPTTWYDATLMSGTTGTGLLPYASSPGRTNTLYWDVPEDLEDTSDTVIFRVKVADSLLAESSYQSSAAFSIKTTSPSFSADMADFVNGVNTSIDLTDVTNTPSHYMTSESASMSGGVWTSYSASPISHTIASGTDGSKTIYIMMRDQYYNLSDIEQVATTLHTTSPSNLFGRINGSVSDVTIYTGVAIGSDGSFTPDRTATIDFYADSAIDMEVKLDGDATGDDIGTWMDYKVDGSVLVSSVSCTLDGSDYNHDDDASVTITFKDAAGNESSVVKTIRVNTKVYSLSNRLLRAESSSYAHSLMELNSSGVPIPMDASEISDEEYVRRWDEIFYPETHDYPRLSDGTINESACVSMAGTSNAQYDAVQISGSSVVYDSEGRPTTVDWTSDGTKDYNNLESSYLAGLRYWVMDNTGYGDIELAFERFDLDNNAYGPPYNRLSPYQGDCLVLYDASAEGAVQEVVGPTGGRSYTLLDSSLLTELYAYTGSGTGVIELSTGYSVGSGSGGSFSVPTIRGVTRVCMILYSDASHTASGFKLKAGPKHETTFLNYDVDETNGEVWIHKSPDGRAPTNQLRMIYDYYDAEIDFDLDTGTVSFAADPSGVVTADYSYYIPEALKTASDRSRLFASFDDDFVDYMDVFNYVTPAGEEINKSSFYNFASPSGTGLIQSNITVDKDRGVIEFRNGALDGLDEMVYVPTDARVTADYSHHTYMRLANDGFGTLNFADDTIVADSTPVIPDYTYVDVKLVNEGDAILENGSISFLCRGYDTNGDGVVDQVLDVNRPWDIQSGSASETYSKVAMEPRTSYTWSTRPTKTEARTILSTYSGGSFGFNVSARSRFWGRVVYVLGGTSGSSYPTTTVGSKRFSAEIEGVYYTLTT